jgi:hypothetical protein
LQQKNDVPAEGVQGSTHAQLPATLQGSLGLSAKANLVPDSTRRDIKALKLRQLRIECIFFIWNFISSISP